MSDSSTFTEIGLRFPDGYETWPTDYGQDGVWIEPEPDRGLRESIHIYRGTTPASVAKNIDAQVTHAKCNSKADPAVACSSRPAPAMLGFR